MSDNSSSDDDSSDDDLEDIDQLMKENRKRRHKPVEEHEEEETNDSDNDNEDEEDIDNTCSPSSDGVLQVDRFGFPRRQQQTIALVDETLAKMQHRAEIRKRKRADRRARRYDSSDSEEDSGTDDNQVLKKKDTTVIDISVECQPHNNNNNDPNALKERQYLDTLLDSSDEEAEEATAPSRRESIVANRTRSHPSYTSQPPPPPLPSNPALIQLEQAAAALKQVQQDTLNNKDDTDSDIENELQVLSDRDDSTILCQLRVYTAVQTYGSLENTTHEYSIPWYSNQLLGDLQTRVLQNLGQSNDTTVVTMTWNDQALNCHRTLESYDDGASISKESTIEIYVSVQLTGMDAFVHTTKDEGESKKAAAKASLGPVMILKIRRDNQKRDVKIRSQETLHMLLQRYCKAEQLAATQKVVLQFDGETLHLDKTPAFYDMEMDDLIEAIVR